MLFTEQRSCKVATDHQVSLVEQEGYDNSCFNDIKNSSKFARDDEIIFIKEVGFNHEMKTIVERLAKEHYD